VRSRVHRSLPHPRIQGERLSFSRADLVGLGVYRIDQVIPLHRDDSRGPLSAGEGPERKIEDRHELPLADLKTRRKDFERGVGQPRANALDETLPIVGRALEDPPTGTTGGCTGGPCLTETPLPAILPAFRADNPPPRERA